jgi:hypothetical protein
MAKLKRVMEIDLETAKSIKGGAVGDGNCSCSCTCSDSDTTEGNTSWQMMSVSADNN